MSRQKTTRFLAQSKFTFSWEKSFHMQGRETTTTFTLLIFSRVYTSDTFFYSHVHIEWIEANLAGLAEEGNAALEDEGELNRVEL